MPNRSQAWPGGPYARLGDARRLLGELHGAGDAFALAYQCRLAAVILGTVLAGYSAVYCLIETSLRYEHPLWWIQVLLIGWLTYVIVGGRLPKQATCDPGSLRDELREDSRQREQQRQEK